MTAPTDRASAFSGLQEGALVLADISGYSKFVAQTEVDHSWSILHELLDTVVRTVHGRMDVSQVEGDAILFITELTTEQVLHALEDTFVAFHVRLRDMQTVSTCPCNACANIGILKLKFVVHHGRFSRQRLGGVEQLHGTDVIIAHRLLKNSVPSKEYILATQAILDRLPDDLRARFIPHEEPSGVGTIAGGYEDITYIWAAAQARERKSVSPDEAQFNSVVEVEASADAAYRQMLNPKAMERYLFSDNVESVVGARGSELGAEFHCHHGYTLVNMRVVSADPGRELTVISDQPTTGYVTTRFADAGNGRTQIQRSFLWEMPDDPALAEGIQQMLGTMVRAGEDAIRGIFEPSVA